MELENELIYNEAEIDESILWEIIHKADFPSERLLLNLLPKYKELKCNNIYYQGICFHKSFYRYYNWIGVHPDYLTKDWDCGISISGKYCQMHRKYPAYFAYLLGHELGHAHICCSDIWLHIHCCLVDSHLPYISNKIQQYEYPHERRFDQFGICIAEQIFSREKLNEEIANLMKKPECNNRERLKSMLALPGTTDLNNIRNELIELTKPFKTDLITSWQKDKKDPALESLARVVEDFKSFFKN